MLRSEPAVFGPVASDPTVSRLIDALATGGKRALTALRQARAQVREGVWSLAGDAAPDAAGQVVVALDGVLVIAHSEKQDAAATGHSRVRRLAFRPRAVAVLVGRHDHH
jgi:hypothetical protein